MQSISRYLCLVTWFMLWHEVVIKFQLYRELDFSRELSIFDDHIQIYYNWSAEDSFRHVNQKLFYSSLDLKTKLCYLSYFKNSKKIYLHKHLFKQLENLYIFRVFSKSRFLIWVLMLRVVYDRLFSKLIVYYRQIKQVFSWGHALCNWRAIHVTFIKATSTYGTM